PSTMTRWLTEPETSQATATVVLGPFVHCTDEGTSNFVIVAVPGLIVVLVGSVRFVASPLDDPLQPTNMAATADVARSVMTRRDLMARSPRRVSSFGAES